MYHPLGEQIKGLAIRADLMPTELSVLLRAAMSFLSQRSL